MGLWSVSSLIAHAFTFDYINPNDGSCIVAPIERGCTFLGGNNIESFGWVSLIVFETGAYLILYLK